MNIKISFPILLFLIIVFSAFNKQNSSNNVMIIGQMKDVMWKGKLQGNINLDTISDKEGLYGIGPVEYLSGEILIFNGKSYKSTVLSDTTMQVEETFTIKAPFFAYSNITKWEKVILPDSVITINDLEKYINNTTKELHRPFMFKISAVIDEAMIHIVNLAEGAKVSSPKEAHEGMIDYILNNEEVDIVGFFSTEHQSIFTHHDTYLHMHLITKDRKKMGHLDDVRFKKGELILYLPQYN
ncbi:MAG TPA: acetolactate decarboxylase [Chitinophagaceae bacterium]|nr:acetolactate decarboxylase [Chitinophagaceae bacterium]